VGTQWVLTGYGPAAQPVALPDGAQVTAEFTSDQVKGAAPCNSYGGGYSVDGKRLTVGQLVQTERACLREDLMALESTFLKALSAATSYTIDGDTLTIDYDGGVLRFSRSVPAAGDSEGR
jgi:heat shock protein HslJ